MYANQVPRNYKNAHEWGPGGSVCAKTLLKRRPEAQDHFPTPPGSKKTPIFFQERNVENPDFYESNPAYIESLDKLLKRLICHTWWLCGTPMLQAAPAGCGGACH